MTTIHMAELKFSHQRLKWVFLYTVRGKQDKTLGPMAITIVKSNLKRPIHCKRGI